MKALITQRQSVDAYSVPIDSLESTYIQFFEALGIELYPISNFHQKIEQHLSNLAYDFVIITGGGTVPSIYYEEKHDEVLQTDRDIAEKTVIEHALSKQKPILGICRGMQYINGLFGGKISKLDRLHIPRPTGYDHPILIGEKYAIMVNHFHQDGIYTRNLASGFTIIATDMENEIVEGYYSADNKILGLQWHPERVFLDRSSKEQSRNIIKTFIENGGVIDESHHISSWTRH